MRVPGATYRIQCHAEFPLAAVRAIVPYLDDLGISDVYLSPITQARAGSTHGYDVVDPRRLDPRIGDERELRELGADLRNRGMGLLLDIVPNHMATSPENPWWLDVLENGAGSPYAGWFDIQWQPTAVKGGLRGKLLLPILGAPYGEVLENKELQLALEEDLPVLRYYEHRLPLSTRSFPHLLRPALAGLRENHGAEHPAARALARLADESDQVPPRIEEPAGDGRADAQVKRHLSTLLREHPEARVQLERAIEQLNGIAGDPASFNALDRLLSEQPYWLAYWRLASQEINYRRFFNITDLVAVRVEERAVFDAVHEFVLWLAREGIVGGFRVDHIDGLWSPAAYLKQLQRRLAGNRRERAYVVVEKILARGEELPQGWECAGTTGYEFILALNDLLVDSAGLAELGGAYARLADGEPGFEEVRYEKKKLVMQRLFGGEVASLAERLGSLASLDRHARDLPLAELGRALVETTACLAVYRTYIEGPEVAPADRAVLERALAEARRRLTAEDVSDAAFSFLRRVLLMEPVYG
ncbi:MAG: malto-oligosyltrehalose synthase, partial [Acidobacteria bacterium]|nr:malto-oligosyltrehalose synthase [Acidobacteriota bacterium]